MSVNRKKKSISCFFFLDGGNKLYISMSARYLGQIGCGQIYLGWVWLLGLFGLDCRIEGCRYT
jgi:hypothetical protein